MPDVSVLEQIHCVQGLLALHPRRGPPPLLLPWEARALEAILELLAQIYAQECCAPAEVEVCA